jgi:hypothetical protein
MKRSEGDMVALRKIFDLFVPAADAVFHCGFQPTVITETGGVFVLFNEWTFIGFDLRLPVFVIGTQDDICREIPCLPNLQGMRDFIARLAEFLWVEFR